MNIKEPLIQQDSVKSQTCCVDRNFLNLESSLPKWQSTSDAVRRLTHLGFLSKKFIHELTQVREVRVTIKKKLPCL